MPGIAEKSISYSANCREVDIYLIGEFPPAIAIDWGGGGVGGPNRTSLGAPYSGGAIGNDVLAKIIDRGTPMALLSTSQFFHIIDFVSLKKNPRAANVNFGKLTKIGAQRNRLPDI